MNYNFSLVLFLLIATCISCDSKKSYKKDTSASFENQGHQLVNDMVKKIGSYDDLKNLKDVIYTYTYQTPDGKTDISTEKYIFDGELSLGEYQKHERTLSDLTGVITQGYNGKEFWLMHDGKYLQNEDYLKRVKFNRKTNFYWFTMFQKLLDPSVIYEYIKEEKVEDQIYDVIKITFNVPEGTPSDIYQLYINRETSLVDQFLFTVVDFGVVENPMLMKMEYQKVDGIRIPSKRKYKKSTWDAAISDDPWIHVTWTDIRFNNKLSKALFDKQ